MPNTYTIPQISLTKVLPRVDDYLESGGLTDGSAKILILNFSRSVSTLVELKGLVVTNAVDGQCVLSRVGGIFYYSPSSTATPNDVTVVKPNAGSGRWLAVPGVFTALSATGLFSINQATATNPAPVANTLFHITAPDSVPGVGMFDTFGSNTALIFRRANGTSAAPSAVQSTQLLGHVEASGYGATAYGSGTTGRVDFVSTENWTDTAQGTEIRLRTTPNGSLTSIIAFVVGQDGSATILGGLACGGALVSSTTAANLPASTTAASSMRLAHGAAPTSPVNGDMWTTTAGLFVRIDGSTVGPLS